MIAGILMALASPALRAVLQNNRAYTISKEFVSMLSYARSEAIKRGVSVSICAASDNTLSACETGSSYINDASWGNGWLVFVDENGDGDLAANGDILRVHSQLPDANMVNSIERRITYGGSGFPISNTGNFTFLTNGCTGTNAKLVTINPAGRAMIEDHACP